MVVLTTANRGQAWWGRACWPINFSLTTESAWQGDRQPDQSGRYLGPQKANERTPANTCQGLELASLETPTTVDHLITLVEGRVLLVLTCHDGHHSQFVSQYSLYLQAAV